MNDGSPTLNYSDATMRRPDPPEHRGSFVSGDWTTGARRGSVTEASTDERWCEVDLAETAAVGRAVTSAVERAQRGAQVPPAERRADIERFADAIDEDKNNLAALAACATGRPVSTVLHDDVPLCTTALRHFAGLAEVLHRLAPRTFRQHRGPAVAPVTSHQPLLSCVEALAPALCCGTPIVLISEAQAAPPLLRLVEFIAGIDALQSSVSLLVVAAGAAEQAVGEALDAGAERALPRRANSDALMRPALLFADCDVDQAVEAIVQQALVPALPDEGRGCHVFVEEAIERDVVDRLRDRLATLRIGNALDARVELGPVASRARRETFEERLRAAEADGVDVQRFRVDDLPEAGHFAAPALLTGVRPDQDIAQRPLSGPALSLTAFRTPDEALGKLQATGAQLGGMTIWSEKSGKALALARQVDSRDVFCNTRDRLTPALTTGSAVQIGDAGDVVRLLPESEGGSFLLEVQAPQPTAAFSPLCRCKQIVQAIGV
jgi:aldehyde dehydrogenase (NAD+)